MSSAAFQLYTDGGCDPNPGHCAAGAIIIDENETVLYMLSEYIGMGTNNLGELTAILHGLQRAVALNIKHLDVYSDSELCVHLCSKKKSTKKDHLLAILAPILEIVESNVFDHLEFNWIKGHAKLKWNECADRLCTNALNLYKSTLLSDASSATPLSVAESSTEDVLFMNCPFNEKEQVKQLGAKWNKEEKKWYAPDTPENRKKFAKWLK
jgi:ribonuclease HI